jgi:hypothetical protein
MSNKENPVMQMARKAIEAGEPLEVRTIRAMREESKKAVSVMTAIFWAGIVVFNVALWVPLPMIENRSVLYVVAALALVVAVIVPIIGLRKHKMILEMLKVNKEPLKKKTANEAGRIYIDKVKNRERPFINAEYELLYGSKWNSPSKDE